MPDIPTINPSIEVSTPKALENCGSGHLDTLIPPALDTQDNRDDEDDNDDPFAIPEFLDRTGSNEEPPHDENLH